MATTTRIGGTSATTALAARWSASLIAALCASQIGAALFLVFECIYFAVVPRTTLLHPFQLIASYAYGDSALVVLHPVGYLWALAFALGVAAIWGMVYGVLATAFRVDKSLWAPIVLGIAVGLTAQLVDIHLITPPLLIGTYGHDTWAENVPTAASWIGHILFGLGFCAYPAIFRRLWLSWSGRGDVLVDDPRIR